MINSDSTDSKDAQPVILLGASNVTLAFPLILNLLRAGLHERLVVYAAHGHGRSYGMWSRVLVRSLPGISQCELWSVLQNRCATGRKPLALLTDVGNDLMYGASVNAIADWVGQCIERLQMMGSEVIVTQLPLESVSQLARWRFLLTRTLFFPHSRLAWTSLADTVQVLGHEIEHCARSLGATIVEPRNDWYGFDPIHILRQRRREAWSLIFNAWSAWQPPENPPRIVLRESLRISRLRPRLRRIAGRTKRVRQPVYHTHGLAVSLY